MKNTLNFTELAAVSKINVYSSSFYRTLMSSYAELAGFTESRGDIKLSAK